MRIRALLLTAAVALLAAGALFSAGCDDESDACREYCARAAECLDCGGNVSATQCQNDCVNLSFDQQRQLATCATDCPNILACQQMVGFPPPTPCVY